MCSCPDEVCVAQLLNDSELNRMVWLVCFCYRGFLLERLGFLTPPVGYLVCRGLIKNGERQDEESVGGRRRTEALRHLCKMNPSQALRVRGMVVSLSLVCHHYWSFKNNKDYWTWAFYVGGRVSSTRSWCGFDLGSHQKWIFRWWSEWPGVFCEWFATWNKCKGSNLVWNFHPKWPAGRKTFEYSAALSTCGNFSGCEHLYLSKCK